MGNTGKIKQPPDDGTYDWTDPKTGEQFIFPTGVQPFWDYAPGASLSDQVKGQIERKIAGLPSEIAGALQTELNSVLSSPALKTPVTNTMIDKQQFATWVNEVTQADYKARHEFRQVGVLPDFVMADKAVSALNPINADIHISDHQLRHAVREFKKLRGATLPMTLIEQLPEKLTVAEWLYDSKHNNLLAVFDIDVANTVGKSVVAVNFKKGKLTVNSIVTSGIINPEHLTNPIYKKIKK